MKSLLLLARLAFVAGSLFVGTFPGGAAAGLDELFPVRGLAIAAPRAAQLERFLQFMHEGLAPRAVNVLILRVDYNFRYRSRPELAEADGLSTDDVARLVDAGRKHGMRLVPQINLLGHQSWAGSLGNLLRVHPEFDETPWVKMPAKYQWPNPDKLYCKSYCPLHPGVHDVVFPLVDELCAAFMTDAFHAGMDEVFYLGESQCPRCGGKDKAELFAGEVKRIRDHLAVKGRRLWIWGDRLLDGATTGIGEWEASRNDTQRAIDLIPKDVFICDWHYERADPTAAYFALKGFEVATCPWKNAATAVLQAQDLARLRQQGTKEVRGRVQGLIQTVWSGAGGFMDEMERWRKDPASVTNQLSEARCFVRAFEELHRLTGGPSPAR